MSDSDIILEYINKSYSHFNMRNCIISRLQECELDFSDYRLVYDEKGNQSQLIKIKGTALNIYISEGNFRDVVGEFTFNTKTFLKLIMQRFDREEIKEILNGEIIKLKFKQKNKYRYIMIKGGRKNDK